MGQSRAARFFQAARNACVCACSTYVCWVWLWDMGRAGWGNRGWPSCATASHTSSLHSAHVQGRYGTVKGSHGCATAPHELASQPSSPSTRPWHPCAHLPPDRNCSSIAPAPGSRPHPPSGPNRVLTCPSIAPPSSSIAPSGTLSLKYSTPIWLVFRATWGITRAVRRYVVVEVQHAHLVGLQGRVGTGTGSTAACMVLMNLSTRSVSCT